MIQCLRNIRFAKRFARWRSSLASPAGAASSSASANAPGCFLSDALRPHPILSLIPSVALDRLLAQPAFSEYPKGTVVFREREPCEAIYVIISGRCESRVRSSGGSEEVEEVFGPGDTLGERAFINHEPHRATVTVITHSVLLRLPSDELRGILAKDPGIAGRFTQSVADRLHLLHERQRSRGACTRRIVSLLPLSPRVDATAVMRKLAGEVRKIGQREVLLIHLVPEGERVSMQDWPKIERTINGSFCFSPQLQHTPEGFMELRLAVGPEPSAARSIAPLLGHCGRHFVYVLLHVDAETQPSVSLQCLIQADLSFVLLQPSMQNLYDFQLLIREVGQQTRGDCHHVKPILFAEEDIAAPEIHATLKQLGHPLHSFARGLPLRGEQGLGDRRFELHTRRLAREIARCRVGLALSSGGAKGLAHVGAIQVLEENGIEIDCIAGSSIGAYVGALWAYGFDGAMLEKIAREHEGRLGLWALLDPVLPPRQGFLRATRVVRRLRRSIGEAHFSDLVRPLRVVATHLDTLERIVFSSGEVAGAVGASIAVPGVVVPVTLDGETYIDGGIADPLPVDVLEEMGIERIIAVNVIPPPERLRFWRDAAREQNGRESQSSRWGRALGERFNYFAHGNILDTMLQAVNGAQTRIAEASARGADVVLRPLACGSDWHDFTHPAKYINLGRKVAEGQLDELKALTSPDENDSLQRPLAVSHTRAA